MWVESATLYLMDERENIQTGDHGIFGHTGGVDDVD
jgi:hypothetical protein